MATDPAYRARLRHHMLTRHGDSRANWAYRPQGILSKPALVCDSCGWGEPLPAGEDGPYLARAVMLMSVSWEVPVQREDHGWSGEDWQIVHNNPPWNERHDIIRRAGDTRDREDIETLPTWKLKEGDRLLEDLEVVSIVWVVGATPVRNPLETVYDHILDEP